MPSKKPTSPVTSERIAERAYELFLARGGHAGYHVEDWLQAERELNGANGEAPAADASKPVRRRSAVTTAPGNPDNVEKTEKITKPKPTARPGSRTPKI